MNRMMSAMEAKPAGDIDRDFVAMMARTIRAGSTWPCSNCATARTNNCGASRRKSSSARRRRSWRWLAIGEQNHGFRSRTTQAAGYRRTITEHVRRDEEIGTTDELFDLEKQPAGLCDRCHIDFSLNVACGSLGRPGPRRRGLPRHSNQPSRPRLRGGTIFEHGVGHRSRRQQAARRDSAWRSPARQLQPALQGTGAGPRHGLFARPQDACRRLDRIEFGDLHRHRDERGQARHLCRPFAA